MEQFDPSHSFVHYFLTGAGTLGYSFSTEVIEKFALYYDEFCRWNRSVNLTALRTDKERAVLLFVDSLAGELALSSTNQLGKIIDIGTGGGFPGLPLKLALPSLGFLLMEPRGHKTAFLHYIIGKLDLTGISVLQKRLEDCRSIASEEEKYDIAMCKGVNLEHILPHIKHIVKKDGKVVVFRSKNIDNHPCKKKVDVIEEIPYELPFGYGSRVLSILKPP